MFLSSLGHVLVVKLHPTKPTVLAHTQRRLRPDCNFDDLAGHLRSQTI